MTTCTVSLQRIGIEDVDHGDTILLEQDDEPRTVEDVTYVDDELGSYLVAFDNGDAVLVSVEAEVFVEVDD
jgi:hypothetical protein